MFRCLGDCGQPFKRLQTTSIVYRVASCGWVVYLAASGIPSRLNWPQILTVYGVLSQMREEGIWINRRVERSLHLVSEGGTEYYGRRAQDNLVFNGRTHAREECTSPLSACSFS